MAASIIVAHCALPSAVSLSRLHLSCSDLARQAGHAVYKMRKAIVEPVFGQIKEQRGFRRFSLRGKQNVGREWKLVCAASNLLTLFRAGWASTHLISVIIASEMARSMTPARARVRISNFIPRKLRPEMKMLVSAVTRSTTGLARYAIRR
jgi:hypothetical protein